MKRLIALILSGILLISLCTGFASAEDAPAAPEEAETISDLAADTDGDGISDFDEERLGLDPEQPSDLTTVLQVLSEDFIAEELRTGNVRASLEGYCSYILDGNARLNISDAEAVIKNPAILGQAVFAELPCSDALKLTLSADSTDGLILLHLDENGQWSFPEADYQADHVSVEITGSGIYALADAASLLRFLGADGKKAMSKNAITLSDFRTVTLAAPLTQNGQTDTDGDGLTDWEELGAPYSLNLVPAIDKLDTSAQVSSSVKLYAFKSDPTLIDTDYDGIEDTYDNAPNNNVFSGTMTASSNDCDVSYTMNYRWFFNSPYTYNQTLCTTSLVYSTMIYSQGAYAYDSAVRYSGGTVSNTSSIVTFLKLHGFENPVDYNYTTYSDDDVSEIALGHRKVTYNGQTKHIVIVDVRGTNGTQTEWSSNFDLGDHTKFNSVADWVHYYNHKGFDVAATRALQRLTTYTNAYVNDGTDVVYWVMGHSRGAAIANILSADLIDEGKTVFGYTFATPNTTTRKLAHDYKYSTIYNVVNEDDFVPCVPMSQWGFIRYGKTATIDMTDAYQNEWHGVTGSNWYNEMADDKLQSLCTKLAAVASGWDDCYIYHCSCHGDGTRDDMTEDGLSYDEVYGDYSARARQYCKVSTYTNFWGTTKYKACQLPAFFMQALADVMCASGFAMVTTLTGYDLAARYEPARDQVVICAAAGIADPHLTETYYVLTQHATSSLFVRGTITTCTHSYSKTSTLSSATCTAAGRGIYTCSKCGDKYKADIAALGHNYVPSSVYAPTCTEYGFTRYTCSRCSAGKYDDYTDPAGHTWGMESVITPATETATGLAEHTCTVCQTTEQFTLPMLEHTHHYTDTVTAPTCENQGYTTHSCTCGDSYQDSFVPALGHIEAAPVTENITSESCTLDGGFDTVIYCETCGAELSREHTSIPASGHSFDEGTITTAATCISDGAILYTCTACETVKQEILPATGHNYEYEEEDGVLTGTCTVCRDTVSKYRITYSAPDFANVPDSDLYDLGNSFELPELKTVCGYVHMGFVTAPINDTTTEPTFFQKGSTYTVSGTETLYAVYAYYKNGSTVTGDIYYPAYTGTDGSLVNAMAAVGAKNTTYSYRETYVAPAVYCYGYTGTAAQNTALLGLLKKGMLIDPAKLTGLTKYYTTEPAGCVRAETDERSPTCTQNGYHGESCDICGYFDFTVIAPTGHSFTNGVCSGCGLRFQITSAALQLNEDINLVYTATIPEGFNDARMKFTFLGRTYTVSEYAVNGDNEYQFTFPRITPQYMGDSITATLYADLDGQTYTCTKENYSVRTYCENLLTKFPNDTKLKQLISDLLAYGAAAQNYTGYETEALVTSGLSLTPAEYPGLSGLKVQFTGEKDDTTDFTAAAVVLRNSLAVRFYFTAESTEALAVQCELPGRTERITADDFRSAGAGLWYVELQGIKATEFDETVTAAIFRGETQVGRTVSYSVNTYICSVQNDTSVPYLAALVKAIYNYGASAKAYTEQ